MGLATALARGDEAFGLALDRVFPPRANPWRHLGALAFLSLVVCAVTGLYLFAVFDTSVAGAYESGRALDAGIAGSLLRGLHRYSADALVVLTVLHLAREAARGHFRFHRAWSWLSGVVLVPLVWIAGLTGIWLAWDERALFSAVATAEWLAAWPFGFAAFARNFASGAALSDRFFSLVVFVHLGVPLFALAATWAHVQRLSLVRAWPPAAITVPFVVTLAGLALAWPAGSTAPADAAAAPAAVALDWFYLFPHAAAQAMTPAGLWIALGAAALVLAAMPWLPRASRAPAARVALEHCNGCGRCEADCPFAAITMQARSDGRRHRLEARVEADRCAACGICAGACPSSVPLGGRDPFASGIELPGRTIAALRQEVDRAVAAGEGGTLVFRCGSVPGRGIAVPCVAMVPPSFVQYALRRGAHDVHFAACAADDCEHRLGERWMRERFAGRRVPRLRASVPRERVRLTFGGRSP